MPGKFRISLNSKKLLSRSSKKFIATTLILSLVGVALSQGAFLLTTWIMKEQFALQDTYLRSECQFLCGAVFVLLMIFINNAVVYRRRLRELATLSTSIQKVANGDFSVRIDYKTRDSMSQVYKNFNRMSAELESLQILRNDFINHYSHEFKTPLASINGFASLMLEKELSKEEQEQYLRIIKEESERLSKLTQSNILLSKLNAQQIVTNTERYDLGEQIRQCAIMLSDSWLQKNIEFTGDIQSVKVVYNKELLQQLWLNILGNAVKYTPEGGEIIVRLFLEGDMAVVEVEDTGIGISSETRKHLFDPYYQGDSTSAGQGLGLSIAKKIVDLCEGTISVTSEVNVGSKFTVRLPAAKEENT